MLSNSLFFIEPKTNLLYLFSLEIVKIKFTKKGRINLTRPSHN